MCDITHSHWIEWIMRDMSHMTSSFQTWDCKYPESLLRLECYAHMNECYAHMHESCVTCLIHKESNWSYVTWRVYYESIWIPKIRSSKVSKVSSTCTNGFSIPEPQSPHNTQSLGSTPYSPPQAIESRTNQRSVASHHEPRTIVF